jgi:hypothetical protein
MKVEYHSYISLETEENHAKPIRIYDVPTETRNFTQVTNVDVLMELFCVFSSSLGDLQCI